MQTYKNPFEGIVFPQYRKYKNGKSCFMILSSEEFEEKNKMGSKIRTHRYKATILPDRNFILDLLTQYSDFAEVITEEEYNLFS